MFAGITGIARNSSVSRICTSATTAATDIVVAAPLPPVSIGSQTVRRGLAGNLQTADGRATVTWQPGAVPVGKTVSLTTLNATHRPE